MVHMVELKQFMTISPRWKDAEFLLVTALYRVDSGLAHISTCVALTAQLLHAERDVKQGNIYRYPWLKLNQ